MLQYLGILKKEPNEDADDEDESVQGEADLEDESGDQNLEGPKMTQLNGPVLDPTFVGRGDKGSKGKRNVKKVRC